MLRMLSRLLRDTGYTNVPSASRRLRKWVPYAAAVLIAATAITYVFFGDQPNHKPQIVNIETHDIAPGGNRARLSLADGRVVELSEEQAGIVVGKEEITYEDGSALGVGSSDAEGRRDLSLLELSTPKGGTYQLTLSDGSKVWLNSASILTYPTRFSGNERIVELEGEGYFEIAKDMKRPFKVRSAGQEVKVLGTEFNISAYADEMETKTTLVEGQVEVAAGASGSTVTLSPGKLVTLSGTGKLITSEANIKKEIAWKSGWFHFENTSFADMMRQIGRWYDVDVRYDGNVPNGVFGGIMDRNVSLKTLLGYLGDSSGLLFELNDRTLIVRRKTEDKIN